MKHWVTPATNYPNARVGCAELTSTIYNGYRDCYHVRGCPYYLAEKLTIRLLTIHDQVWMVDDPPHWWNIQDSAKLYHGHVLCAGLGLGLIVHALNDNPKVTKITVVERERNVIDLVVPFLPQEKLEIVHDDFWESIHRLWNVDGVFFDLFVGDGYKLIGEALRTFVLLHEQFGNVPIHISGFPNKMFEQLVQ